MTGVFFRQTFVRHWRQVIYWGIGLGFLGLYIMLMIPNVDALEQYARVVESVPPVMLDMFGISDAAALATPAGFISFGFFGYTLLIMAAFAVMAGLHITANEEDDGILDLVLSLPVTRGRVLAERFAAWALMAIIIVGAGLAGLLIGLATSSFELDAGLMVVSSLNMIPSILLVIAFTAWAATFARRRSTALGLASAFVIISYFIDFLGRAASESAAAALRALSFFSYYDAESVILHGMNLASVAIVIAATALLLAAAWWGLERRDIGV